MKLKHIMSLGILAGAILIQASCKLDNYPAPGAGIHGAVLDQATGKPVPTEQPNGIDIRLIETKYGKSATPSDFWCRPDGTFENTQLFAGQYKTVPIQGAFFPADTIVVNISGQTEVNFKVTPFLNIAATVTATAGGVTVNYTLSREKVGDKIVNAKTIVSAYPSVSNIINEFNVSHDLSAVPDATALSTSYSDQVTGLKSGNTYYVRVAAATANANSKYNYSQVVKITAL